MNLYIIEEVLFDYWGGMVCIKAKSLEHCREIFVHLHDHKPYAEEFDLAISKGQYKVLKLSRSDKTPVGEVAVIWGGS
jgi:hypothetical protein